jgi:hypothetical protein
VIHYIVYLALLFSLSTLGSSGALELVMDGQPRATLVIPDEPWPVHRAAAEELQYHVRRASGAELPLVPEREAKPEGDKVYLGPCRRTRELGLWPQPTKPNGYVLRTVGRDLFICGDDTAGTVFWMQHANRTRVGTLFGVYELLERELTVRWLWPGELGTIVPQARSLSVGDWNETGAPPFIHARWADYGPGVSGLAGWSSNEVRERFIDEQGKWLRRHRFALGIAMDNRRFLQDQDFTAYGAALERLDAYRASIENDFVSNLAHLNWTESFTWGRPVARLMAQPHKPLSEQWQFAWDPDRQGEAQGWFAPELDTGDWLTLTAHGTWDTQPSGRDWKADHGADYTGVAWYRQTFTGPATEGPAWLVFGAVACACQVWVDGQRVLTRPYPQWGSPDAWKQPFVVEITAALGPGPLHSLAVRVESNNSPGGIWRPVWVVYPGVKS